jgi:hypothetical protein
MSQIGNIESNKHARPRYLLHVHVQDQEGFSTSPDITNPSQKGNDRCSFSPDIMNLSQNWDDPDGSLTLGVVIRSESSLLPNLTSMDRLPDP